MPSMKYSKAGKTERKDDTLKTSKGGKYIKVGPVSQHVADLSSVNRHPTTVKRSEYGPSGRDRNARSLSVPSLHSTAERTKYSPPLSPPKQRSRSVRDPTTASKKTHSFRRAFKQMFGGSHSELENGGGTWTNEQQTVGTYRPLNFVRPKSMGESSDCSNSSILSRENSLRDSSRSRIREKDSVFHQGGRQASTDSNDYTPHHTPSDTNLRPISMPHLPRNDMTRSSSSASLKNFGLQTKPGVPDARHFSIAAIPTNSTHSEVTSFIEDRSSSFHPRSKPGRHLHRQGTSEDTESLCQWEDSSSFQFMNGPVLPSHPEYKQVAHDLMSASPSRTQIDLRRMSDASLDPRRVSNDSGVESLSTTKHNRSLPTTPIAPSFVSASQSGGASSPELRPSTPHTPHGYLSQESNHSTLSGYEPSYKRRTFQDSQPSSYMPPQEQDEEPVELPPGWELVKSIRYGTYYVNHNNKTAMYQHPYHARPPPPYHRPHNYADEEARRRTPARSHSHRSTQSHRVLDSNASLPRRSKSFRDQEMADGSSEVVSHERQLSTMTFVPPSPYQIKEIPRWIKDYVEKPFGSEAVIKMQSQWRLHSYEELTEVDTMIKRLFKKGSEQIVRNYEYYRVALQQEIDERARERKRQSMASSTQTPMILQGHGINEQPYSPHRIQSFRYPSPPPPAPVDNPPSRPLFTTHSPPPEPVHTLHHPHPHSYKHYERDMQSYRDTHSLRRPHTHQDPHTMHHPHHYHIPHTLHKPHPHHPPDSYRDVNLLNHSATPHRAQSYTYLPRVNSQVKVQDGFSDVFNYSSQNGTMKPTLSNTEFHGLEETFV